MTVYAKQVDKHQSTVLIKEDRVDTEFATLSHWFLLMHVYRSYWISSFRVWRDLHEVSNLLVTLTQVIHLFKFWALRHDLQHSITCWQVDNWSYRLNCVFKRAILGFGLFWRKLIVILAILAWLSELVVRQEQLAQKAWYSTNTIKHVLSVASIKITKNYRDTCVILEDTRFLNLLVHLY